MSENRENMSYKDIKQIVLNRIQNRTWQPNSYLPTETSLADEFSSTRTTVNRALRELADEGYLERKRKAGTKVLNSPKRQARFVIPITREEVISKGAKYRYALINSVQMTAPEWLVARLHLSVMEQVFHVRSMHYADNKPFQFEERWIVGSSVPEVMEADFSGISPNEWLVNTVPFTNLELTFSATSADHSVAEFLDAQIGEPVFLAERTTWLNDQPVTFARLYYAPGYRMTTFL